MKDRISIITDEISRDLDECREFLDKQDIRAVELRVIGDSRVPDISNGDMKTLKRWVKDDGISVVAISPGLFKCDVEDRKEANRQLREVLPRSIEMARELEALYIITFSFNNPRGLALDSFALDSFCEAAGACAVAGIELLVENEPGFLACTGDEILELLEKAGHPSLKVNWDPANSNRFGTEELTGDLEKIFAHVRNVHVKNGRRIESRLFPRYCSLREGEIDWPAHLRLLKEMRYPGYLGIETHYEPLNWTSVTVLRELREMLDEIKL